MSDAALPTPPAGARRLVYLGSPEVAVGPLRALVEAGYEVALVISRADRRRGRGASLSPSPVKAAAQHAGLLTSDDVNDAVKVDADLGVVVAYGRLIRPEVLHQLPCVNLHFSLLPRWRGAAPVERAILAGDATTGVCVMAVEEGLDTGGIYRSAEVPIAEDDTLSGLRERLARRGTELLLDCLDQGFGPAVPQRGEPVYAAKIDSGELRLAWSQPAAHLVRVVALERAWASFRGKRLLVHRARLFNEGHGPSAGAAGVSAVGATAEPGTLAVVGESLVVRAGDGWLELLELQTEGRARQSAPDWCHGSRVTTGEQFH